VLYLTLPACLLALPVALMGKDVLDVQRWQGPGSGCLALWTLLLPVAVWAIPWMGLSPRDDVAERRNRPAGWVIAAAALALTLAYGGAAGGYLGAQIFGLTAMRIALAVGLLGALAVVALWSIFENLAGVSEAITVERDAGAACRASAALLALGLLVGQALPTVLTKGDPVKALAMLGGPAVLLLSAVVIERLRTPTGRAGGRPRNGDVLIALSYLGCAGLWIYLAR
jgi:hypothetical protein